MPCALKQFAYHCITLKQFLPAHEMIVPRLSRAGVPSNLGGDNGLWYSLRCMHPYRTEIARTYTIDISDSSILIAPFSRALLVAMGRTCQGVSATSASCGDGLKKELQRHQCNA